MTHCYHLAGIIPIASRPAGYEMPWDDCLIPIAPNYMAFENAIYQAAMAGCETLWVVCPQETTPLVRKRIGDYIFDPAFVGAKRFSIAPDKHRKLIPIYYVPIKVQNSHKASCIPWSILRGAVSAREISSSISKWTRPDKYFVSFPYGIYPASSIRSERKEISKLESNWCLEYQTKTYRDEVHLSFTFSPDILVQAEQNFKDHENQNLLGEEEAFQHYTYNLKIKDIFQIGEVGKYEIDSFSQIDSWKLYKKYLASELSEEIRSPGKIYLSYREWNPIAEDLEDENME